ERSSVRLLRQGHTGDDRPGAGSIPSGGAAPAGAEGASPVLLEVNRPLQFYARLVDLELTLRQNLDDARRLRIAGLAGRAVGRRHADHLRVAAQIHVRAVRIERGAEPFLELAAGDQVLDVDLLPDGGGLARRQ